MLIQTNFGAVSIKNIEIVTDHQQYLGATMYIPKIASAENKCPVVVTSSGWEDAGETWSYVATELARRGIIVVNMEPYSHGSSEMFHQTGEMALYTNMYTEGMGMIALVEYITGGTLDFVDTTRVGVTGLSMGGICTWTTVQHYGMLYNEAIEAAKSENSDGGTEITASEMDYVNSLLKVTAALPCGSPPTPSNGYNEAALHVNVGCLMGSIEECGDLVSTGNSTIVGDAIEGLEFVNAVLGNDPVNYVNEGEYYGNRDDNTLRVIYQPFSIHGAIPFVPEAVSDIIDFFTYSFKIDTSLTKSSLVYPVKLFFNAVSLIGLLLTILPLVDMFLTMPVFSQLKAAKEPEKIPALSTKKEKTTFWLGIVFGGLVAFVTAVITVGVYMKIFPSASNGSTSAWFNIAPMNLMITWTVLNTIWVAFWFWYNYKKDKAAGIRTEEMIGWKIGKNDLFRTFFAAIAVFTAFYLIVFFAKWAFNTDFRIWMTAVKTFKPTKLIALLNYWPFFFLFYLSYSLLINGAFRVDGMKESANLLICGIGNSIGCVLLLIIQYSVLLITGYTPRMLLSFWNWSDTLVLGINFWLMFIAPIFLRKFFKKTGNVWMGATVMSLIYASIGIMKASMTTTLFM